MRARPSFLGVAAGIAMVALPLALVPSHNVAWILIVALVVATGLALVVAQIRARAGNDGETIAAGQASEAPCR